MSVGNPVATARKPPPRNPYAVRTATARSKMTNGTRGMVLPGIDQRSAVARRFRDVMCAVVADSGGIERLSEARIQLIRRFSALVVQAETMEGAFAEGSAFDFEAHARISSTLVRLATRIGLKRVLKDAVPSLAEILQQTEEDEAEEDEAEEDTAP
jgi:hypothetical protein